MFQEEFSELLWISWKLWIKLLFRGLSDANTEFSQLKVVGQGGSRHLMLFTTSLVWTRFSVVLSKAGEYKYVSMGVFSLCMWSLSVVSNSLWPHEGAHHAPPSMGFSRQEFWSGLPSPSPGDLLTQGLNPGLLHCRQMLYRLSHHRSLHISVYNWTIVEGDVNGFRFPFHSKDNFVFASTIPVTAAAKSLQSCPTLWNPTDGSPPGSPVPGILQARTLEWVAISFSNAWKWKVKVKSLSHVPLLVTPWTAAYQAPPPMGFSRQEDWTEVPLPSPIPVTDVDKWVRRRNKSNQTDLFNLLWKGQKKPSKNEKRERTGWEGMRRWAKMTRSSSGKIWGMFWGYNLKEKEKDQKKSC